MDRTSKADKMDITSEADKMDITSEADKMDKMDKMDIYKLICSHSKYRCYIVGGYVRDYMLGRAPNDLDILVEQDAVVLGRRLANNYGGGLYVSENYNSCCWTYKNTKVDIISARKERYVNGELRISKATIIEDLESRDFTINAMAMGEAGILDPLGGLVDLKYGIIRSTKDKIYNDPVRIIRGIKLEQRYGFTICKDTMDIFMKYRYLVKSIAPYKLNKELTNILYEVKWQNVLWRLTDLDILVINIPNVILNPVYLTWYNNNHIDMGFSPKQKRQLYKIREAINNLPELDYKKLYKSHILDVLYTITRDYRFQRIKQLKLIGATELDKMGIPKTMYGKIYGELARMSMYRDLTDEEQRIIAKEVFILSDE